MPLQLIEVTEVLDPATLYEGFQRLLSQPLDLHPGFAAEVDELAYQPGGTVGVLAVELLRPTRAFVDHQHLAAAGADNRDWTATALGVVLRNLGDDHVRLIDGDLIPRPQSQLLKDVQVVQIGVVDGGAVNLHIIKHPRKTDHARPSGGNLQRTEYRFVEGIRPLECHQTVLMVAGGAQ